MVRRTKVQTDLFLPVSGMSKGWEMGPSVEASAVSLAVPFKVL